MSESLTDAIHVLHVDDDPDFADLTVTYLEREDDRFSVETAHSASDGLDRLDDDVDCVVSDYDMPGQNGIEFLETVRDTRPDLPFILFTGKGSEAVASDAISAGVTDYLQKGNGSEQYELLANRITNAVEQARAHTRADEHHRVSTVVREINQALVQATHHEAVRHRVCEIIADADPYVFAWIGTVDPETNRIEPRASAGIDDGYLDAITVTADDSPTGRGPGGTAVREDRIAVSQDIHDDDAFEPWREEARERDYQAVASIPLTYGDTQYGLLSVYADRPDAFDQAERELLSELGDTIAHAFHRIDIQNQYENQYKELFEQAPVMFAFTREVSGEPVIEDCNRLFADTLGYTQEELRGRPLAALYTDESAQRLLGEGGYDRALAGEFTREQRDLLTREGDIVPTLLRAMPRRNTEGEVVGTHALFVDIGDQTRLQRLESLQERLSFALDATDSVLFECDPDEETITRHGPFERLYGLGSDSVRTATEFDEHCVHPADREAFQDALSLDSLTSEAETITHEFRTHPDYGDVRWIESAAYVSADPDGTPRRIVGLDTDITDQKEREQALRALHEATRELIDAPDKQTVAESAVDTARTVLDQPINGLWLYDPEADSLVPVVITEEAEDILGSPPTYSGGASLSWRAFVDDELQVYDDVSDHPERLNAETPIESEIIVPLGDHGVMNFGATEPAEFTDIDISLVRILGNAVEAALSRADREQQLRARSEEVQRQNERLEEFASVVSHDLRNPLTVAEGRLELARADCESSHLDDAMDAIDRSQELVEDLLTLARGGAEVGAVEPVALSEVVAECWQHVATGTATLRIDTEQTIEADRSRLQQLLENLVRNATEHGGPDVTVTVGAREDGFYVADDGPGIPVDERDRVFEAGYSTTAEGTGFGLRIVEQVVEAHGWDVAVSESELGGTRFDFTGVDVEA